jgi:hypothetical protein
MKKLKNSKLKIKKRQRMERVTFSPRKKIKARVNPYAGVR